VTKEDKKETRQTKRTKSRLSIHHGAVKEKKGGEGLHGKKQHEMPGVM